MCLVQRCMCKVGFRLQADGLSCKDVDECQESSPPACSHICLNTRGSLLCQCHHGFLLEPDGRTCKTPGVCVVKGGKCFLLLSLFKIFAFCNGVMLHFIYAKLPSYLRVWGSVVKYCGKRTVIFTWPGTHAYLWMHRDSSRPLGKLMPIVSVWFALKQV